MHGNGRWIGAGIVLASVVTLVGVGSAIAKPPAGGKAKLDPIAKFGDAAARDLTRMARQEGLAVESEHTAAFAREDVVLVAAPLAGIASIPASQLLGGKETPLAAAYICAPCQGVAEEGTMAPDLYVLSARAVADPTGGTPALELVWTGTAGQQYVWPGALIWAEADGTPSDPAATRIDVAVHELDTDVKPAARDIVIQVWIQIETWRACWKWVIKNPL